MTVVERVVGAIADAKDVEPHELDLTLENHVDTDALQLLHAHKADAWELTFELPNRLVRVDGGEGVLVDGTQYRPLP